MVLEKEIDNPTFKNFMLQVINKCELNVEVSRYQQYLNIKLENFPKFEEILNIYQKLDLKKT